MNKLLLLFSILCINIAHAQYDEGNEKYKQELDKKFTNPDTYLKEAYNYVTSLEKDNDLYFENNKRLKKDVAWKRYRSYNFSKLFTSIPTNSIIGFIGTNYQRFYIHIASAKQDTANPEIYYVIGKSRVKNTVCSFKGTFRLKDMVADITTDKQRPYNGLLVLEYNLLEDSNQNASGLFHGVMHYCWYETARKEIKLEDMLPEGEMGAIGIWKSYKTNVIKRCNWGYGQIDLSPGLTEGDCCFYIAKKYVKNGWEDYVLTYDRTYDGKDAKAMQQYQKALKREEAKWWQ